MSARDDYPHLSYEEQRWRDNGWAHEQFTAALDEIDRLRQWKQEAMTVLSLWDAVADKVPGPLGGLRTDAVAAEIDRLRQRVADLEAIPPHPAFLPWAKIDPGTKGVIVKTESGWVFVGPEPPVDWASEAWDHFKDVGPLRGDG